MSEIPFQITEGIRVSVKTTYLKDNSNPTQGYYAFAYQIEITNESNAAVQLLSREWFITDAMGKKRHVEGPGVVGKQPIIQPGETFRYMSGCDFPTPMGKMHGYYYMLRQGDQEDLRVDIPTFTMIVPYLHN